MDYGYIYNILITKIKGGGHMKNIFERFDYFFINLINGKMRNNFFDKFMYIITDLGGAIASSIFTFSLILFGNKSWKLIGLEAFVVLGISQIIVQTLKILLSRERPYNIIEKLNTFGIELKDYSFPSGHTTASFSIAATLSLNIPEISIIVFFLASIIGISRIYLGVHYPTDVLAGIILGVSTSIIVHMFLIEFINRLIY